MQRFSPDAELTQPPVSNLVRIFQEPALASFFLSASHPAEITSQARTKAVKAADIARVLTTQHELKSLKK